MVKLHCPTSLQELAISLGAELIPAINKKVNYDVKFSYSVATLENASEEALTFLANPLYVKYLKTTKAAAVILSPNYLKECNTVALVTKNPRLALAKLLNLCNQPVISKIHHSVVIGENVQLGNDITLEAGVIIGNNCIIGNNTVIKANVVLYDNVKIGNNCIINSNTVIGSDGFGYAQDFAGRWVKIHHLGGVIIEDDVEIGSNTAIDRGCIEDTIIKQGVIIDNLVQIAHNVIIGENTAIAGCTGIAGSTVIGKNCLIGGAVSIGGHLLIADEVHITATSAVSKSLLKKGVYSSGLMVKDNLVWKKNIARFNCLDHNMKHIFSKLKHFESKLNK